MNRARPAAAKHRIGTSNQFWQFFRISDHGAEGREPGRDRRLIVEFVDRPPAFTLGERGARSGQHEQGLRIAVSLGDAGRRVGHTRAGDDRTNTGPPGCARVAVGHETRALLVATLHVADPRARDAAIQLDGHRPGHAEHRVHFIGRE